MPTLPKFPEREGCPETGFKWGEGRSTRGLVSGLYGALDWRHDVVIMDDGYMNYFSFIHFWSSVYLCAADGNKYRLQEISAS